MKLLLIFALSLSLSLPALAQTQDRSESDGLSVSAGPRKQVATVIYAGLAGAVLGLSTLSFHGRPQDHLESIAGGFAIGIIVGAIFSSYGVATDPSRLNGDLLKPKLDDKNLRFSKSKAPLSLSHTWTF